MASVQPYLHENGQTFDRAYISLLRCCVDDPCRFTVYAMNSHTSLCFMTSSSLFRFGRHEQGHTRTYPKPDGGNRIEQ